jgi:hypothetical protein
MVWEYHIRTYIRSFICDSVNYETYWNLPLDNQFGDALTTMGARMGTHAFGEVLTSQFLPVLVFTRQTFPPICIHLLCMTQCYTQRVESTLQERMSLKFGAPNFYVVDNCWQPWCCTQNHKWGGVSYPVVEPSFLSKNIETETWHGYKWRFLKSWGIPKSPWVSILIPSSY